MIDSLSVEIASHSVSHPRLTELSDTIAIKYELAFSKQILESLFGQEVITFVYPYGKYDDPIIRMVSAAGYKIGRTCDFGEPNFWVAPLKIPIKEVRNTTLVGEIINHIKRHDETVLLFHRIVPKPHSFTDYSVSQFDSLLAVLLRRKVKVVSLRGIYDDWCQKVLQRAILERGLFDKNYWQKYLFQKVDIDQTRTPSRL
jgi:peptidoglycan/xylan/chitin deacetylase (PgdA/CDA1 family)